MRRLAKELFAHFGLRISRINPMPSKPFGADKYFNTGPLSPLEENSQDLYDRFYADDVARDEYYSGGRLILIDAMARFIRENVPLTGDIIDVGCGTGHLLSAVTAGKSSQCFWLRLFWSRHGVLAEAIPTLHFFCA
jgi:hypothetical protein